jgi:sialate O-acetylesterase
MAVLQRNVLVRRFFPLLQSSLRSNHVDRPLTKETWQCCNFNQLLTLIVLTDCSPMTSQVQVVGTGPPNSKVQLTTPANKVIDLTVDGRGGWRYELPPQPTIWNQSMQISNTVSTDTITVSFGETLLCSGQSNMQMPVAPTSPCCKLPPSQRKGFCSCFAADNSTAGLAAAGQYTGKIAVASVEQNYGMWNGSYCPYPWTNRSCISHPEWNTVVGGEEGNIGHFSALCWYTGVSLFEQLGGDVPVGLMVGSVGGSPIEFWLPPNHVNNSVCGIDTPPCDNGGRNNYTDSEFFEQLIFPFMPFTVGTVLWDQGERDVRCAFSDRNLHSRMPLDPTPARLLT